MEYTAHDTMEEQKTLFMELVYLYTTATKPEVLDKDHVPYLSPGEIESDSEETPEGNGKRLGNLIRSWRRNNRFSVPYTSMKFMDSGPAELLKVEAGDMSAVPAVNLRTLLQCMVMDRQALKKAVPLRKTDCTRALKRMREQRKDKRKHERDKRNSESPLQCLETEEVRTPQPEGSPKFDLL